MPFRSTDPEVPFGRLEGTPRPLAVEGTDVMQARQVVIRTIELDGGRPETLERFHSELLALARLNHPHLERIHHLFRAPAHYLTVSERIKGEPLDELLRRNGPMPWRAATSLMCQVLDGMQQAHLQGVVHRELCPANLVVAGDGELKVRNFGILRGPRTGEAESKGPAGGALAYLAPEQIRGEPGDCRSDIYAAGTILFELLAGQPLLDESGDTERVLTALGGDPVPPQTTGPNLPDRLRAAILRAVAKAPRQRFQTAFEFCEELTATLAGEGARALPERSSAGPSVAPAGFEPSQPPPAADSDPATGATLERIAEGLSSRWSRILPWLRSAAATGGALAVIALGAAYYLQQPALDLHLAPQEPGADIAAAPPSPPDTADTADTTEVAARAGKPETTGAVFPAGSSGEPSQAPAETPREDAAAAARAPAPFALVADPAPPKVNEVATSRRDATATSPAETTIRPAVRKTRPQTQSAAIRPKVSDGGWKIISD